VRVPEIFLTEAVGVKYRSSRVETGPSDHG
jgi:hypothetical protein